MKLTKKEDYIFEVGLLVGTVIGVVGITIGFLIGNWINT